MVTITWFPDHFFFIPLHMSILYTSWRNGPSSTRQLTTVPEDVQITLNSVIEEVTNGKK